MAKIPTRYDYIRYALDGLKYTSPEGDMTLWTDQGQIGRLVNFAHGLERAYELSLGKDRARFSSAAEFENRILEVEHQVRPDNEATLRDGTQSGFKDFCRALFDKMHDLDAEYERRGGSLTKAGAAKAHAMAAWVAYELDIRGEFFTETNHLVAKVLESAMLMRYGLRLPVYRESARPVMEQARAMDKEKGLKHWTRFYKQQFAEQEKIVSPEIVPAPDAWQVENTHLLDPKGTISNTKLALRGPDELFRLHQVTGYAPKDLAVFKPSRMALHETIVQLVTRVKMKDPKEEIKEFINSDPLYQEILKEVAPIERDFNIISSRFEGYARYLVADHFHVLNPQATVRAKLEKEKATILSRIETGDYDPRAVESAQVLRQLVGDHMLRTLYEAKVRQIVEQKFDTFLKENPDQALPTRVNADRFAWVTVGGPAAGKSSAVTMITEERERLGNAAPLCVVNPDAYRDVLLEHGEAVGTHHGTFTHSEASHISDRVIGRLEEMIAADNAPDIWIDTAKPKGERIKLAREGYAQMRLYVASCPADVAVERAFTRAQTENNPDFGRYMPTEAILSDHRESSDLLPEILPGLHVPVKMFDTSRRSGQATPIFARREESERVLNIEQAAGFVELLKKTTLNKGARSAAELYPDPAAMEHGVARALVKYIDNNIPLNFFYDEHLPAPKPTDKLYASLRKDRSIIFDLETFNEALMGSTTLTVNVLKTLAQREQLDIRSRAGRTLLIAEKGEVKYNAAPNDGSWQEKVLNEVRNTLKTSHDKE